MKSKYLNDNDKWILAEDMPNMDLFFSAIFLKMYVSTLKGTVSHAYKKTLAKYGGYHLWFYYGDRDSYKVGEKIVDKLIDKAGLIEKINNKIIEEADKLRDFSVSIPQKNLKELYELNGRLASIVLPVKEMYKDIIDDLTKANGGNLVEVMA